MWSISQRYRLATEKNVLAGKMRNFQFYNPTHDTYVAGGVHTRDGNIFQLKLVPREGFPDEMPNLYVVWPLVLRRYGGGTVNEVGISHEFHTWTNGPGGCVQICHTKPNLWDSSTTILGVLVKGQLWLEGYSQHLRTGISIDSFLEKLRRSV